MDFKTDKNTIQNIFIFAFFALMFVVVVMIFKPFYSIILWSLLLYFMASPLYKKIIKRFDPQKKSYQFKCSLMSGIFAVCTMLIIMLLFIFIGVRLVSQLASFTQSAEAYIRENPDFLNESDLSIKLKAFFEKNNISTEWMQNFSLRAQVMNFFQKYGSKIFSLSRTVISGTGNMLVSSVFMIFVLFFFYRDASYLSKLLINAMPINSLYTTKLLTKFSEVLRGLTSGYLLVALYQGIIAFILMSIFKIPSALLFSVILMFFSFVPMFGCAIIWAPIGITMCFTSSVWQGILFLLLSAIFVSGLDNFLRPMLLKDRIKVHPLVIFFAILGGIKIFGLNGLILGPLVIIMFFTLLDLLSSDGKEESEKLEAENDYDEGESDFMLKIKA
nr:AI-2E family transporter [Treponemataceae bacterium]